MKTNSVIGKKLVIILLLLAALLSVVSGIKNAHRFSQDFQWDAAKALCLGYDPYDLSLGISDTKDIAGLDEFYDYFESIDAKQKMEANQFPSLLILLFIYTLIPYRISVHIWILSNLIFTAAIIFLLRKTYMKDLDKERFLLLSLLMIAGTPWRNQIGVGQHTLFAFAFFLLAVFLSEKDKYTAAGLALAVSYFKYTLTAPLALIFIYKRKWKSFILSVLVHILLTAASAAYLKESFIDMIIKPLKVSSALAGEGSIDISAVLSGSKLAYLLTLILMIILVGLCLRRSWSPETVVFSFLLLISLVITYHRSYDFFVLIAVYPGVLLLRDHISDKLKNYFEAFYWILLIYIFFGLRIFSESPLSLAAAAVMYYLFLIVYPVLANRGKCAKNG